MLIDKSNYKKFIGVKLTRKNWEPGDWFIIQGLEESHYCECCLKGSDYLAAFGNGAGQLEENYLWPFGEDWEFFEPTTTNFILED